MALILSNHYCIKIIMNISVACTKKRYNLELSCVGVNYSALKI